MRLVIIRHGDPDYERDSLTPKGWREAELLAKRMAKLPRKEGAKIFFYMSPLGRAQDTASLTLKEYQAEAEVMPWLREFHAPIQAEDGSMRICWDFLPGEWTTCETYYDKDAWREVPVLKAGKVGEEADRVWAGLDGILAKHGYVREGNYYRAARPNQDVVVLFCHFGVEAVMLAHLLGVSPIVFLQGLCASPSSVTTLYTEERREGIAAFRMNTFGDQSHLYAGEEEPSFAARFCECYSDEEERHD